jgi:hypothetical protein
MCADKPSTVWPELAVISSRSNILEAGMSIDAGDRNTNTALHLFLNDLDGMGWDGKASSTWPRKQNN